MKLFPTVSSYYTPTEFGATSMRKEMAISTKTACYMTKMLTGCLQEQT